MKLSHRSTQLLLRSSQNTFICHRCRHLPQISQFSTSLAARASSDEPQKPDLATRLRRRIWGTDNPPGQKDPYRKLTAEEKATELAEQEIAGQGEVSAGRDTAAEIARRQSAGEYTPASDWHGLERIGGPTGWWEEEWDKNNIYRGFLTKGVLDERAASKQDVVRRVALEILALKQAGAKLHDGAQADWAEDELVEDIDIVKNEDGSFALREQTPDLIDELVELLQRPLEEELAEEEELFTDDAVDEEALAAQEQQLLDEIKAEEDAAAVTEENAIEEDDIPIVGSNKVHDPIYLDLPLTDLAFKFAFVKRLTFLLGTRIPDPKIASFKTLGDVVAHLLEKPKPTKLAEILLQMPELTALPNVEIHSKKRTFVDKETEIGRWKVIEAELKIRGLPVDKSERVY